MIPVSAVGYTPGVKGGDYVKYSDIGASWQSTVPGSQKPQSVTDFQNSNFFQIDISSVTGNNVTAKFQANFKNGTVTLRTFIGNVDSGQGNLTSGGVPLVAAGGLGAGDKVWNIPSSPTFNTTSSINYAGASREVNTWAFSFSSGGGYSSVTTVNIDKVTGVLLEYSTNNNSTAPQGTTTQSERIKVTETNLWSPTILGLAPLYFYGIIALVIGVVIVAVVLLARRTRKPSVPTAQTAPPNTVG